MGPRGEPNEPFGPPGIESRADVAPVEQLVEEAIENLPSPEEERVLRWRLDQFLGLGFDLVCGTVLADSPADLSLARRLVGNGCPVETAVQILI